MLQMPPHINNSLEISVKQLKNNSNGQQFSFQNDSLPLGITNNNSGNTINNSNISASAISNQLVNNNRQTASPPIFQSSISFNFLVNEIEDLITSNNLNTSVGEEEDDDYCSDSNLSMEGLKNDSNIINNNAFDLFTSIDNNSTFVDPLFTSIKNEQFDFSLSNILNGFENQGDYTFANNNQNFSQHTTNLQMPLSTSNEQEYVPTQNSYQLTNKVIDTIKIKKEYDDTNSSFSSNSDTNAYMNKHALGLKQLKNEKRYGPIVVRPRKNPAPTLRTGRKSKYIELTADEEKKRELRRSRNRQAAEKCKQKRSEIEDKLENDLKLLLNEQANILNEKTKLLEKKLFLDKLLKQHIETCVIVGNNSTLPSFQCKPVNNNSLMYSQVSPNSNHNYNTSLQQQQRQQQPIQQNQMNINSYPVLMNPNNATNLIHSSNQYGYSLGMNPIQTPTYDQQQLYSQQQNMNSNRNQIQSNNKINHLTSYTNYEHI